ncbi:hypothetical protein HTZ84_04930 [Haloterrigena sp. SYSU A558-1]|uniref:Uncharacterized protein n=1 Tax=Haloterrigena gelatinilytica TaxID=2741724 RepID=A0ABX2L8E3_9EURY|nr:hypothetical protein [Haloterrigena gelatinilytica]NUC71660.1 hypothetical protein [Haloterrigena gelatinilytica]
MVLAPIFVIGAIVSYGIGVVDPFGYDLATTLYESSGGDLSITYSFLLSVTALGLAALTNQFTPSRLGKEEKIVTFGGLGLLVIVEVFNALNEIVVANDAAGLVMTGVGGAVFALVAYFGSEDSA